MALHVTIVACAVNKFLLIGGGCDWNYGMQYKPMWRDCCVKRASNALSR
jgi:hypothetical protein